MATPVPAFPYSIPPFLMQFPPATRYFFFSKLFLTTWLARSGLGHPFIISPIVIELDRGAKHNGRKNKGKGGRKQKKTHSTQPLQD